TLDRLLFPKQAAEFAEHRRQYGNTAALEDRVFFYGLKEGEENVIRLIGEHGQPPMVVRLDAVGEPDEKGMRQVVTNVNGQIRPMKVRDRSVESVTASAEKADTTNPGHVAAPFAGVVMVTAKVGDEVKAGDPVAVIEAMKMEATITATKDGVVDRVALAQATKVEGGDLIVVIA
ncbi:MAG TPA: biotin/lipoyl-containing protein, partial [Corynebacterium sp.]|nr:biotin/lipoyl-containing protein [Corynebacterium sp.]